MLTRITTNGVLRGYKSQLMRSANNLNGARDKVLTKRNFNSYAEDPAAAAQAFQLRRAFSRASDQISNSTTIINRFESAWTSMGAVAEELYGQSSALTESLDAANDPTGAAREALAKALKSAAEGIVQDLNVQYGDSFIFAGADGQNVPFSWDNGKLYYRGVSVDAGGVKPPEVPVEWASGDYPDIKFELVDADGHKVDLADPATEASIEGIIGDIADAKSAEDPTFPGFTPEEKDALRAQITGEMQALQDDHDADLAAYDADQADYAKLQEMAKETNYIDLGLGLQEDADGALVTSSGYNYVISGLDMLGYGVDDGGDPKNAVSIIMRLSEIYGNCDADGNFAGTEEDEARGLLNKLKGSIDGVQNKYVELDGKASYLKTNKTRLEDYADTLNEEILSIEQVDLADAITEFSWAQYSYNAALKVGNSILSQSLIDYMG